MSISIFVWGQWNKGNFESAGKLEPVIIMASVWVWRHNRQQVTQRKKSLSLPDMALPNEAVCIVAALSGAVGLLTWLRFTSCLITFPLGLLSSDTSPNQPHFPQRKISKIKRHAHFLQEPVKSVISNVERCSLGCGVALESSGKPRGGGSCKHGQAHTLS